MPGDRFIWNGPDSRILAVADSFDAMSSSRPYRPGMPFEKVEMILREGAGSQWDPHIVDQFLSCRDEFFAFSTTSYGRSVIQAVEELAHVPVGEMNGVEIIRVLVASYRTVGIVCGQL